MVQTALFRQKFLLLISIAILFFLIPYPAFAAQTGINPWEISLGKIAASITGPVAYSISIITISISGLIMAFVDLQSGFKRLFQVIFGLSCAFFATQITTQFCGFSGAVI